MPPQETEESQFVSTLGFKYPTLRDNSLHTGELWLSGKQTDDGAEGLWRIHDKLFDFSDFAKVHPGGEDWLTLTKGTDITEAFEAHHVRVIPEKFVLNYYVREATLPRNSPFTFRKDGFYRTLKGRVGKILGDIPENASERSAFLTDFLLFVFLFFALLSAASESFLAGIVGGITLALLANASHNFFHKRDNVRMYYFNFTLMSSRSWRVSHVLSHHLYTNTVNDLEISSLEPFLQHLPREKNFFFKYLSYLYFPVFYCLVFFGHFVKMILHLAIYKKGFHGELILPFLLLFAMIATSNSSLWGVSMFVFIEIVGSFAFSVIGINAAHHHPKIFHDGDAARPKEELDWGVHQMDATKDRREITGSHFLGLTNYGDHCLHHLFPTIDHGKLEFLYPVFKKTCEEFGIDFELTTQMKLIRGQFVLMSKTKPRGTPPKPLKKPIGS